MMVQNVRNYPPQPRSDLWLERPGRTIPFTNTKSGYQRQWLVFAQEG